MHECVYIFIPKVCTKQSSELASHTHCVIARCNATTVLLLLAWVQAWFTGQAKGTISLGISQAWYHPTKKKHKTQARQTTPRFDSLGGCSHRGLQLALVWNNNIYIFIYIHILHRHTHTHTYIYIYIDMSGFMTGNVLANGAKQCLSSDLPAVTWILKLQSTTM